MKYLKLVLLSVLAASTLTLFPSCASTGGGVTSDVTTFWNSPEVQKELNVIRDAAFTFLNNFLHNKLGASKLQAGSPTMQEAINAAVADISAKHPNVPKSVIEDAVRAKASKYFVQ